MTDKQQPEALSLADWLDAVGNGGISTTKAAAELRRQHARITELEAQLKAVSTDTLPEGISRDDTVHGGDVLHSRRHGYGSGAGFPGWKLALPGGKHTDEWESARVGDYNRGWNDYRKAAVSALSKITSEDRVRDGWAKASQWLRNNYQDHPNIASLCDAMLVAANTLTPVIECTCKAEDMPSSGRVS